MLAIRHSLYFATLAAYACRMGNKEVISPDQFFSAAFMASPDLISISSLDEGVYLEVNEAFCDASGYSREEVIGKSSNELSLWAEPEGRRLFLDALRGENRVRGLEVPFRLKNGEIRRFQVSAAIARVGGRDCIVTATRDISASARLVESLEKSAFLLERAEEMARIGSWEFDFATGIVNASQGSYRIYGFEPGGFSIKAIEAVPLPEYRPLMDAARDALIKEGKPYDIEFRIRRKSDGEILDIHSKARWDARNKRLFGILRDVTEEKKAGEELRLALSEKETLLKELYHRTKNNMQVISSLLSIEAGKDGAAPTAEVFAQMRRRIDSMALVHEMLYRSRDLSRIDLKDFVPALVELLRQSMGDGAGNTGFAFSLGSVELPIDAAMPCSIILNELLTNALIHAFPNGRPGSISVSCGREPDGSVFLSVIDDGAGAPPGFDGPDRGNLGLVLVRSLGEDQLRGSVRFRNEGGFGCFLRFRDDFFEARV